MPHAVASCFTVSHPKESHTGLVPEHHDIVFRSDVTVELVRHSASDADGIFAARVSTQGEQTLEGAAAGQEATERDKGVINYLMRDRHGSPFEQNSLTLCVQAPIFVFREFMRHRIASYNEESGRYRELRPVFYVQARSTSPSRGESLAPTSLKSALQSKMSWPSTRSRPPVYAATWPIAACSMGVSPGKSPGRHYRSRCIRRCTSR